MNSRLQFTLSPEGFILSALSSPREPARSNTLRPKDLKFQLTPLESALSIRRRMRILSALFLTGSEPACAGWHRESIEDSDLVGKDPCRALSRLQCALTDKYRVLPCFSRNCPFATPLESALTKMCPHNSFRMRTYEKQGVGGFALPFKIEADTCKVCCDPGQRQAPGGQQRFSSFPSRPGAA